MATKERKEWEIARFTTDSDDFELCVGRPPKNKKEMEDWVHYLRNGVDSQLDWDIIYKVAADQFKVTIHATP